MDFPHSARAKTFDQPIWPQFASLRHSPLQGLYFRPGVYRGVRGLDDFQPWLDRIVHFPEAVVDQALKQIPPAWVIGDEDLLSQLCESLLRRRKRVVDLIQACRHGRAALFPEWH